MSTAYDRIAYKGMPFVQTHPERLAMLAKLYGMEPAPVDRCRVLELGCTDGGNLIPMALALPGSQFVGVDLAHTAIAAGREVIRQLGLTNIELHAADLASIDESSGLFDFVIAHGIYSWVPAPAREHILRISKRNLAPRGVAYISYNAHPGGHMRQMIRDMMLFHVRDVEDPEQRIAHARALIAMLAEQATAEGYRNWLREEFQGILERDPHVLFHDELSESWQPFFFHEFMSSAQAHGLQFLSEANFSDMQDKALGGKAEQLLKVLGPDRIDREQYRDFLKCRRFRQTLLCHDTVSLTDEPMTSRVQDLFVSSPVQFAGTEDGATGFTGPNGSSLRTAHPVAIRTMEALIEAFPRPLHFEELLQRVGAEHRAAQAEILLATFAAGVVQLHAWRASFSTVPSERPVANPLARLQAAGSGKLTTFRHTSIDPEGELERRLIVLLDGTRDRAALQNELRVPPDELNDNLRKLALFGLLGDGE